MAKSTNKANKANEVDDLLDDPKTTTAEAPETTSGEGENGTPTEEELIEFNGEKLTKAQIEEKIKALQAQVKEMKAVAKGETAKAPRVVKGVMVAFKNKKGDTIIGPGVTYYVARADGKLHYKEASQVVLLPEGWKEGDPIDWSSIAKEEKAEEPQA